MDFGVLIRQLQNGVGGLRFRTGSAGVTFTASTDSAVTTVTHGLDSAPSGVWVTVDAVGSGQKAYGVVGNLDSDSFDVVGISPAAFSGTLGFYWLAIWG